MRDAIREMQEASKAGREPKSALLQRPRRSRLRRVLMTLLDRKRVVNLQRVVYVFIVFRCLWVLRQAMLAGRGAGGGGAAAADVPRWMPQTY